MTRLVCAPPSVCMILPPPSSPTPPIPPLPSRPPPYPPLPPPPAPPYLPPPPPPPPLYPSAQIQATTKRGCRLWAGPPLGPVNRGRAFCRPPPPRGKATESRPTPPRPAQPPPPSPPPLPSALQACRTLSRPTSGGGFVYPEPPMTPPPRTCFLHRLTARGRETVNGGSGVCPLPTGARPRRRRRGRHASRLAHRSAAASAVCRRARFRGAHHNALAAPACPRRRVNDGTVARPRPEPPPPPAASASAPGQPRPGKRPEPTATLLTAPRQWHLPCAALPPPSPRTIPRIPPRNGRRGPAGQRSKATPPWRSQAALAQPKESETENVACSAVQSGWNPLERAAWPRWSAVRGPAALAQPVEAKAETVDVSAVQCR